MLECALHCITLHCIALHRIALEEHSKPFAEVHTVADVLMLQHAFAQVQKLFAMFLGNAAPGAAVTDATVAAAAPALQVKLMSLFTRSLAAANAFPQTLQV